VVCLGRPEKKAEVPERVGRWRRGDILGKLGKLERAGTGRGGVQCLGATRLGGGGDDSIRGPVAEVKLGGRG